jgi:putative hydrolase of the HAD superfamily
VSRAPISLPGRTVIFDYGGVISLGQSAADREVIADLAGAGRDSESFWRAYFAHRDGLDQGGAGVVAYWQAIADDIGASWDDARVHELWVADFRSWLSINPGTIEVLADLKAGGTALALLSNAGPDFGSYFRHGPLGGFFTACYVSGELGLIKPDLPARAGRPGHHRRRSRVHRRPRGERPRCPGTRHHQPPIHRCHRAARLPRLAPLSQAPRSRPPAIRR